MWEAGRGLSWHIRDAPEHYAVSQVVDGIPLSHVITAAAPTSR
jgi:hypothetical protein